MRSFTGYAFLLAPEAARKLLERRVSLVYSLNPGRERKTIDAYIGFVRGRKDTRTPARIESSSTLSGVSRQRAPPRRSSDGRGMKCTEPLTSRQLVARLSSSFSSAHPPPPLIVCSLPPRLRSSSQHVRVILLGEPSPHQPRTATLRSRSDKRP